MKLLTSIIILSITVLTSCGQPHDLNKYKVMLDVTYTDGSNEKVTLTVKCYHDPSDEFYLIVRKSTSTPCIEYDLDEMICGVRRFTIINIQKLD